MLDEYVGEIIKIPNRRIRWGLISFAGSCAVGATSTAIGYAAYEMTASSKEEKIQKFKQDATKYRWEKDVNMTKYYGTKEGMEKRLEEVNKALKNWLPPRTQRFTTISS